MSKDTKIAGRLDGMVALITGSGGGPQGGIGAGIARSMAAAGAKVAVNELTEESAAATVEELRQMGSEAWAVIGSVAESQSATALVTRTADHFGQLDILVNNAGIITSPAVERTEDENWHRILDVNLHGPFYTCRAAVRLMHPKGFGRIINISSVAGIRISYLGGAAYTTSKSGLIGFTRHLASEVAQYGITVNALLPGMTSTPLFCARTTPETRTKMGNSCPAGYMANPDDMGGLAVFFASREADYVTGTAVPVDGGFSLLPGDFSSYRILSNKDSG